MFTRREDAVLTFKNLEFECMVHDLFEAVDPKNMKELEWMVDKMISAIQLCAGDHALDSEHIDEEWEDIYFPY